MLLIRTSGVISAIEDIAPDVCGYTPIQKLSAGLPEHGASTTVEMKRIFKKYKFKGHWRVKAGSMKDPRMDLSLSCKCAGCVALWLNLAYNMGLEDGQK